MTREVVECVLRATERIEAVEDVSVKTRHSRIVWMGVRRSGPPSRFYRWCGSQGRRDGCIGMIDVSEGHRWRRDG